METMCSRIVKFIVACDGERLKVIVDFYPFDAPTIYADDTQINRGDAADTGASTRHREDVYAGVREQR